MRWLQFRYALAQHFLLPVENWWDICAWLIARHGGAWMEQERVVSVTADNSGQEAAQRTTFKVLGAISLSHLLNDLIQSVIPAIYPVLKREFDLDFAQIGVITLCFYAISSLIQPVVGIYTDKRPSPFSLAIGMGASLIGLLLLAVAWSYPVLLVAAILVGLGSAVFHPEASRVARMASGGRHGLAQSLFQVGGNVGTAMGPLLAAAIVVPLG